MTACSFCGADVNAHLGYGDEAFFAVCRRCKCFIGTTSTGTDGVYVTGSTIEYLQSVIRKRIPSHAYYQDVLDRRLEVDAIREESSAE